MKERSSCPARAVNASSVISSTSMRVVISSVIRSPIAACTAGSEPSGATVSSNRSVSPIWSWAQVATTVRGASDAADDDQDDDDDGAPPLAIAAGPRFCDGSGGSRSQLLLELARVWREGVRLPRVIPSLART